MGFLSGKGASKLNDWVLSGVIGDKTPGRGQRVGVVGHIEELFTKKPIFNLKISWSEGIE